ncbi:class I SAM-dependent methyltransferase [Algoriphagus boritolerans]|uniref:Ubiquinone/menaquinone biosynthesis C-methylase UbiE n=1 Tax=Algoriphagus boritolerans DSM 17298 = JCM 18970 TaxID=1120964 RepID=A0A1H5YNU7_9BACT|nr:class I SAM-dependent methyltransferase [Algoriphagus boritolerans]SEG25056.1 Ubiquinone/menaquinone biosynthesis C-methylase UbiE [Algoriphagus boritolerans DSM 17298 = JCM 18970]
MSIINDLFASSDHPKSLGSKFRAIRLRKLESLFFRNFNPEKPISILDVGGTDYFWKKSQIPNIPGVRITLLNLHLEKTTHPHISSMIGDATEMNSFEDKKFDLVFSNSVIEHLYTFENQRKMAAEVQRVGRKYFVQTPNKYFPVEAHYALPFAQYLPKKLLFFLLTNTKLSRLTRWESRAAQQYLDEIRLLNEKEMKSLFPKSKLLKEKVLGMTKSLTAHNLR